MNNDKGFTIVEVLAVIVILALIAMITRPIIIGVIEESQKKAFLSDVRSGIRAAETYLTSHGFNPEISKIDAKDPKLDLINEKFGKGTFVFDRSNEAFAVTVTDELNKWCVSGYIHDLELDIDCNKLDKTAPTNVLLAVTNFTTNSISVLLNGEDSESGIVKYEYRIRKLGDKTWSEWQTTEPQTDNHTFSSLLSNQKYELQGKVTNGNLLSTESNIEIGETIFINQPILTVSNTAWTNKNVVVTIKYTAVTGGKNFYSIDGGTTFIETANMTELVTLGSNKFVVAKTSTESDSKNGSLNVTNIDKVIPTCTSSGTNAAWTNANRVLTGTCADLGGSGCVANVTATFSVNTNSTTASPGIVKDRAGNQVTCPANQTVRIDKTAPTCASSGSNGAWTNGNRVLTGTCTDTGGSGCVANVSATFSVNTNLTTASPGIVKDKAGNQVTCPANQTVRIDKTAPTCASSGSNGAWTNGNRVLTGTCTDTGGSGCAANVSATFSTNINSTVSSPGIVKDNAGNQVTCPANQTVRIDKIPPTCTSSGGSESWVQTTVTLLGSCVDTGGSGCTGNVSRVISVDGEYFNQSPGTVKDNAGNNTTCPANQTARIVQNLPTAPDFICKTNADKGKDYIARWRIKSATPVRLLIYGYKTKNVNDTNWFRYYDQTGTDLYGTQFLSSDSNVWTHYYPYYEYTIIDVFGNVTNSPRTLIPLDPVNCPGTGIILP